MIRPLDFLDQAPCYWELADDGAPFKCAECGQYSDPFAADMIYALPPNGKGCVMHKACADSWWIDQAKKMPGRV